MKDYTSPIEMITNSIIKSNEKQLDDYLLFSVEREIGFKVDKEELIKALEYDHKQYEKGFEDGLKSAMEWIPVSERLPKEFESVLVCYKSQGGMAQCVVERLVNMDGSNRWSTMYGQEPIAWMPLPEPYKASPTRTERSEKE